MTGVHRRTRLERLPSLRRIAGIIAARLLAALIIVLLGLARELLELHDGLCERCRRDPRLRRQLVKDNAAGVCWEAFATAHERDDHDQRAERRADHDVQRRRH